MGYIAPVTQFDYIQYAYRIVKAAENVRNAKGTAPFNLSALIKLWKTKRDV
ncbi:UNVERIFIED_ORG: hypothetical protein ABIC97_000259 [Peribacillus simplex]